jgi:hypothetical protein
LTVRDRVIHCTTMPAMATPTQTRLSVSSIASDYSMHSE